jgi:hypothetical protein
VKRIKFLLGLVGLFGAHAERPENEPMLMIVRVCKGKSWPLATLYSDNSYLTPLANPICESEDGKFRFAIERGEYVMEIRRAAQGQPSGDKT